MIRALAWIVAPLLLLVPAVTSHAQHRPRPPVAEAMHLSHLLSREVDAFSYEASILLAQADDYDEIEEELRDLKRELRDLDRALRKAAHRPSKWDCVSRRTEEVQEAVDELQEELREVVRDFRREQDRRHFHRPHDFHAPAAPPRVTVRIGRRAYVRVASSPYPDRYPAVPAPRLFGADLEDRAWVMDRLAHQLDELADQR